MIGMKIEESIEKIKINGFESPYYGTMRIKIIHRDGRKAKLETNGKMTIEEIVDELIKGLK